MNVRIGNCSGFYGDRLSAMREMLEGALVGQSLDYLTGDAPSGAGREPSGEPR